MNNVSPKTIKAIKALLRYSISDLLMNGTDGQFLEWMCFTESEQGCMGDEQTCAAICEWLGIDFKYECEESDESDDYTSKIVQAQNIHALE